jgi:hypothetical protein
MFVRLIVVTAAVAGGLWCIWAGLHPAEARNARAVVAQARADPIWDLAPNRFRAGPKVHHFADADWVPSFTGTEHGPASSVVVSYTPQLATVDDLRDWRDAAVRAGWTYRGCSRVSEQQGPPVLTFTKDDARLIVDNHELDKVQVAVVVPAHRGDAAKITTDPSGPCLLDQPGTWDASFNDGRLGGG